MLISFVNKVCIPKKIARFAITPTTAHVIPFRIGTNRNSVREDSTKGPPKRIKQNEGKKVNQLTTIAPIIPVRIGE